jgi:hypothetical protein
MGEASVASTTHGFVTATLYRGAVGPLQPPIPDFLPATHALTALEPQAYRSAVEFIGPTSMGRPRDTRPAHGYSRRTLRVQYNYSRRRVTHHHNPLPHLN